jgi:hypothetical protein
LGREAVDRCLEHGFVGTGRDEPSELREGIVIIYHGPSIIVSEGIAPPLTPVT